jgi:hypothetical protein
MLYSGIRTEVGSVHRREHRRVSDFAQVRVWLQLNSSFMSPTVSDIFSPRAMIQKTSAPIGYGSASSVAGPNGNPLFMPHQIISAKPLSEPKEKPRRECLPSASSEVSLQSVKKSPAEAGPSACQSKHRA